MAQVKSSVFSASFVKSTVNNSTIALVCGTWTDKPLVFIRKDILKRHGETVMYRDA